MRKRSPGSRVQWNIVKAKFHLYDMTKKLLTVRCANIIFGISKRCYRYERLAPVVRWLYSMLVYDGVVFLDPGNPTWLWSPKS